MKDNKEIKINVPEGYEIDKENSTFECIKFKKIIEPTIEGYLPMGCGEIYLVQDKWKSLSKLAFATEKQAKSALAMAQISQIMANDERFGGVVTDEKWKEPTTKVSYICKVRNFAFRGTANTDRISYYLLAFHTPEQRDLFLKENEDLVKDYLMID